jgi:hypothetical protein
MSKAAKLAVGLAICASGPTNVHALECLKECDSNSAECLQITLPAAEAQVANGLKSTYARLYNNLAVSTWILPKAELMAAFGVRDDPCSRSDTSFIAAGEPNAAPTGQQLLNTGSACRLSVPVTMPSGTTVVGGFALGHVLRANYQPTSDSITFTFPDGSIPPYAFFTDATYNDDWGGQVASISFGLSSSTISTSQSCIRLKY